MTQIPKIIIIMGVSGCGKTTLGTALAQKYNAQECSAQFYDADHFHSPSNVEKMRQGIPLTDEDRYPWLELLNSKIHEWIHLNDLSILACSALKAEYRSILARGNLSEIQFVYLKADEALIHQRLQERKAHYFNPDLLSSQIAALEEPKENTLILDASQPIELLLQQLLQQLSSVLPIPPDNTSPDMNENQESKNHNSKVSEPFAKSQKLEGVCYDIRGAVLDEAKRLEDAGHSILKLNIGNPAPFGFQPPDEIMSDVIRNLHNATGYTDSQGLFSARKAIIQYYQLMNIRDLDIDQVYIGNGVSELIVMTMQALLNDNDEVLIPSPDYPLWTAAVKLAGGNPVHYRCDEAADWNPDLEDMKQKITSKTKAIVLINPNNPTGAVYSKQIVADICELARQNGLMIFSDEIYDKIIYDDAIHTTTMLFADEVPTVTFSGFSKNYRAAGFRVGWAVLRDPKHRATGFAQGLKMLASMRLCSNVPAQYAVQTGLHGYQSINDLVQPGGRLLNQRNLAWQRINSIPGISCVKPQGALYLFPKIDTSIYPIIDDEKLMLQILQQEKILLVHGRAFNWPEKDHFRVVFLPNTDLLTSAMDRLDHFFARLEQKFR